MHNFCLVTGLVPGRQVTLERQALAQLTRPRSRVPSLFRGAWRCAAAVTRQRLDTVSIGFFSELKKGRFDRPAQFTQEGPGSQGQIVLKEYLAMKFQVRFS
ncbi:hypothetical protein C5U62_03220 [Pseudomonas protegens]|uniref:Uncharacterized protein n=1 Tax=Pseudomonas protegens TaxID=380021 RepID=A0A2T6GS69_9PSED|nr:hypothetical protein C5U62_03220 [Pseudomonas protegens]